MKGFLIFDSNCYCNTILSDIMCHKVLRHLHRALTVIHHCFLYFTDLQNLVRSKGISSVLTIQPMDSVTLTLILRKKRARRLLRAYDGDSCLVIKALGPRKADSWTVTVVPLSKLLNLRLLLEDQLFTKWTVRHFA